jgi:tetratricopeptide (TPR) repeat protein
MGESNELFTRILNSGPSQSTLFLLLTEMKKQGQTDDVIRECVKALNVYPDDYRLRRLLAECYMDAGLIDQSEKEMEKVASHIEHLIPVYKSQAVGYSRQGRFEEAAEALKKYLSHRPDDKEALALQDRIKPEQQRQISEVLEIPEVPVEGDEDTALFAELATPTLAEIYYNQGLIQEAINTYRAILSADPGDEASAKRLKELTAVAEEEADIPIPDVDTIRATERKMKMLGILEGWLARIQESSHAR